MVDLTKLMFWKKTPIIEFYCRKEFEGILPEPSHAGKYIPNWYKKLPTEIDIVETTPNGFQFQDIRLTAKSCLPLLDAMTTGYVIPLCADVRFQTNEDCSQIDVKNPNVLKAVEFHNSEQVGGASAIKHNHGNPVKFLNHWIIKTAPGWSTLFLPPLNRFDQPFTCLSGFVDTDKYPKEVNFPAVWNVPNFTGKIPAGTPLVVAIPIKRSHLTKKVNIRKITNDEETLINKMQTIQLSRDHYYNQELRER
jgi:hypothetical protein